MCACSCSCTLPADEYADKSSEMKALINMSVHQLHVQIDAYSHVHTWIYTYIGLHLHIHTKDVDSYMFTRKQMDTCMDLCRSQSLLSSSFVLSLSLLSLSVMLLIGAQT